MDDYFLLEEVEYDIKSVKREIKWKTAYIILVILNILIFSLNILIPNTNNLIPIILFSIGTALWIMILYLNIKKLKELKIRKKDKINTYYRTLKEVDYPRFIKEQRIKKLKKLKSDW